MILNKTILILEDDLLTLSKILNRLSTIEQDQPYEFLMPWYNLSCVIINPG